MADPRLACGENLSTRFHRHAVSPIGLAFGLQIKENDALFAVGTKFFLLFVGVLAKTSNAWITRSRLLRGPSLSLVADFQVMATGSCREAGRQEQHLSVRHSQR
jgi:hypothetical protein